MMRRGLLPSILLSLILASAASMPVHGRTGPQTDAEFLQRRATSLNDRVDVAVRERRLSKKKAATLHLSIGKVQTLAGNLQTRNGTISRVDADRMNQQLTDAERTLTNQP